SSTFQDGRHAWGQRGGAAVQEVGCTTQGCPPMVGYRNQLGEFTDVTTAPATLSNVAVPAGRTKELYVWVPHRFEHDKFEITAYRFNVLVSSDVAGSQVISGSGLGWDACTASQPNEVQGPGVVACGTTGYEATPGIEAVSRDPAYDTNHLVDNTLAERRSVSSRIGPTDNVTYRLRVTNAASFGRFLTQNAIEIPSAMNVTAKHDKEAGWTVKLRFVGQKGWNDSLELFNVQAREDLVQGSTTQRLYPNEFKWKDFDPPTAGTGATRQSFFDREIEMLVQPPNATSNKRVFAGESHSVQLEGRIRHPVLGAFTDALTVTTVIGHLPNVTLSTPLGTTIYPKAGGEAVAGLFVLNNGSAPANISLTARVTSATGGSGLWTVTPSDANFVLTPRENRTFAIRIRAPLNVPPESTAEVRVAATWRERQDDLSSPLHTAETMFLATVIQAEAITITPTPLAQNAEPRKTINFTITVKNDGQARASYRLDTILVPNWTASLAPRLDDIAPNGGAKSASFVMTVPGDIVSGRTNEFVIRVQEIDNPAVVNNVDYAVVTVNIVGGQPIPSLQTNKAQQIVERNGNVRFEFGVRNLGNVDGRFPIALIGPNALGWRATVTDERGSPVDSLLIKANSRRTINLTVSAPVDAPERSIQDIELQVLTPDRTGGDRVNVRAIVHDYGLDVKADPPRADLIPGLQAVFNVRVSNLGNDNDTFNLSLDMGPLTDTGWSYEYGQLKVRVPPNEFRDVRLTVRSPKDNLPTPRTATLYAYSASEGASNLSREQLAKLDSTPLLLTVLDYRVGDVDQDGILEVAVDANKRRSDGFELFREISTTGTLSQAIESAQDVVTGHTRFLIDVPVAGSYDGIADVFWDPDASSVTRIQYTADVNFDAAPDYFLDLNADTQVDRVYDSGGRRYLTVEAKDILGRGELRKQYLVYTDSDRFPDAFYDPEKNEVWKVVPAPSVGENVVGFIPKDKTKPTLYYDVAAQRVYQSPLVDSIEFFKEYWYALVTFLGAAIILGVAIARRKPT
ncbi:MAG TPA: hypothetical protein VI997_11595, partial [Candidatus Thermoplasmatota archaeon]|nr:hypothetical protein [Candidatus Thermoplasmatota archaeon]